MYPENFQNVLNERRTFEYCDMTESDLASRSALPPTKIQISVLDVVPAVWAQHFVETKIETKKKKRVANTGNFYTEKSYSCFERNANFESLLGIIESRNFFF